MTARDKLLFCTKRGRLFQCALFSWSLFFLSSLFDVFWFHLLDESDFVAAPVPKQPNEVND